MAIQLAYPHYAKSSGHGWLDGAVAISAFVRFRLDADAGAARQYMFRHVGPSGQLSLRKDSTGLLRASITAGSAKTKDGAAVLSIGTVYDAAVVWIPGSATGLRLWQNGAEIGTGASTTGQSATYDSGGAPDLWLAAYSAASNVLRGTLESLLIVRDYQFTQDDIDALRAGTWPQTLPLAGSAHVFYPLFPESVSRFQDLGGQALHVLSGDITGSAAADYIGRWEDPTPFGVGAGLVGSGGAAAPAAWQEWPTTVAHPGATVTLDSLTIGQLYQFKLRAEDAAGNLSADSAIVEASPQAFTKHSPRLILLGR